MAPPPRAVVVVLVAVLGACGAVHNGQPAALGQFPWMVSVVADGAAFCNGALVAADWVLTSGHCVDGKRVFDVVAGSLASQGGAEASRQEARTTSALRHPNYDAAFKDYDVGLIHLDWAFTFNDFVAPIRLAPRAMAIGSMQGTRATLSGWGRTGDDRGVPDVSPALMFAELELSEGGLCGRYYGSAWLPAKLCAATGKDRQGSSCKGDAGSPLTLREADGVWTAVGLASFGAADGCALGLPVVLTRVAAVLDFIEDATGIRARED